MNTWYVRCRFWSEVEDGLDVEWRMFGVDESTGFPAEFVGSTDDALHQLLDELGPALTPDTRVQRVDNGLDVERLNDMTGDYEYAEYRLIDPRLGRRRARPQSSGRIPVDPTGLTPNRFLAEFQDVAGEVTIDLSVTIAHFDVQVGQLLGETFVSLLDPEEWDFGETVQEVMSLMLWLFMVGREHSQRGYPAPTLPTDAQDRAERAISAVLEDDPEGGVALAHLAGDAADEFGQQFVEVIGDVVLDYEHTLIDVDREVGRNVSQFVVELLRMPAGGRDPEPDAILAGLLSGALWMFRLGRAHAGRGYASPVPRGDGESKVPDTVDQLFPG